MSRLTSASQVIVVDRRWSLSTARGPLTIHGPLSQVIVVNKRWPPGPHPIAPINGRLVLQDFLGFDSGRRRWDPTRGTARTRRPSATH